MDMDLWVPLMHLIMYVSEYAGSEQNISKDLADILETARDFNAKHDITGMLFCDENRFIQVLEGEYDTIHDLMAHISTDPRHSNIKVLLDHRIAQRELNDWNMTAFNISHNSGKDWSLLDDFRDIYVHNFKVSSEQLITLLQRFIRDHQSFKKLRM